MKSKGQSNDRNHSWDSPCKGQTCRCTELRQRGIAVGLRLAATASTVWRRSNKLVLEFHSVSETIGPLDIKLQQLTSLLLPTRWSFLQWLWHYLSFSQREAILAMPGPGLPSGGSPNVTQACVHTLCGLWWTGLCLSTHWAWMVLTPENLFLALGSLSMDHLFLASSACWVGLGVHTGITSCFTSNSYLSCKLCLGYFEGFHAHPRGLWTVTDCNPLWYAHFSLPTPMRATTLGCCFSCILVSPFSLPEYGAVILHC